MIFVMTYSFQPEKREACRIRHREIGRGKPPEGIKLLGQWTAVGDAKGVAVFESDDSMAMAKYFQGWSDLLSIEIYPAIDNEALAKVIG
jgi:hypothetical protein